MNKNLRNQLLKHLLVVVGFMVITMVYFSPLLQNKVLKQGDIDHWYGGAKEILDFRKAHNTEPLWTNSMFGGMPAYQITVLYPSNLIQYIDKALQLGVPNPANYVFIYFLGFYILLITLRIDYRLAIIGALAFGLSSFFFIVIEAGHNTEAQAIGYMAPVVAGIIIAYRGKYLLGGALTGLAMALELYANHPQITYYLLMLVVVMIAVNLYTTIKEKSWKQFITASAVVAAVSLLALMTNITSLWATADYGKYTTRGQSELTEKKSSTGLDRDYVFGWSYGVGEAWTLLIPNYKGGSSMVSLGKDESVLSKVNPQYRQNIANFPSYWGDQSFTSGPVYVGAIICFLFLLGLLIVEGNDRWWLLGGTILSIFLAWGKNFPSFNYWMFDHFPMYNKFRSVTMALVIAEFCMPLLAVLALNKIITTPKLLEEKKKKLFIGIGIALGITLIISLSPTIFSPVFKNVEVVRDNKYVTISEYDQLMGEIKKQGANDQQATDFLDNIEIARKAVLASDAWRSFFFIMCAAAMVYGYSRYKFKKEYLLIAVGLLIVVDLWMVDKRYINDDSYQEAKVNNEPYQMKKVDEMILQDKSLDYRVMNLSDPFNDARTSYFHKSIGGYHGAKLKRIKELIEYRLDGELSNIISAFKSRNDTALDMAIAQANCINMMNGKYFIYNVDALPYPNRHALGNAWFVKDYKIVPNADAEIAAMNNFNPATTAIIDQRFKDKVDNFTPKSDSSNSIKLISYLPNDLVYETKANSDQLAVFSEIYFESGWNAYVDGKLSPHFRTNYLLRGMKIPAGNHKIEYKFEPSLYSTGEHIALASSALLLILVGGVFFKLIKDKMKEEDTKKPTTAKK
ncbi:MAG: hypothetical protein WCL14_04955 [Bacteroidota bacterium]